MQWRTLDITARDVTLATGESLRTLASFQGHDGQTDIIRAHLALDGGDICLLTEFEDASGRRLLGRTTQWPIEILAASALVFEEAERAANVGNKEIIAGEVGEEFGAPGRTTETIPESGQGGSGDPAAPAGKPELTLEELAASDAVPHDGAGDPNEAAKTKDDEILF